MQALLNMLRDGDVAADACAERALLDIGGAAHREVDEQVLGGDYRRDAREHGCGESELARVRQVQVGVEDIGTAGAQSCREARNASRSGEPFRHRGHGPQRGAQAARIRRERYHVGDVVVDKRRQPEAWSSPSINVSSALPVPPYPLESMNMSALRGVAI